MTNNDIDALASRVQGEAENVKYLLAALDEPIGSLSFHDTPKAEQEDAMATVIVFTRLAKDAATRVGEIGVKLEGMASEARREQRAHTKSART